MTRHVLVGVGGSGQHVVLAYLRLLSLTVPPADMVPHVLVLDADAEMGKDASKRSMLVDDIVALHGAMTRGDPNAPLCATLKPYRAVDSGRMLLKHLVGTVEAGMLLGHGFLADDEDEWGNDWTVELHRGMMANPKVGSIALAHKVLGAAESDGDQAAGTRMDDEIRSLFRCLGPRVRVAIVGSSFGGTGSGVVPALVRVLDRKAIEHARAFMTLPWFAIEPAADHAREASAAAVRDGHDPQERNASLGLHTYRSSLNGMQRSSYVLGQAMPRWQRAARKDQGNYDQEEHPHVLNLVLAGAVQAFLGMGDQASSRGRGGLYALKSTAPSEEAGRFDAATSRHLRFWCGRDDTRQLHDIAADAEATALVLERGGRVLQEARGGRLKHPDVNDEIDIWSGLVEYVDALRKSIGAPTQDVRSMMDKLRKVERLVPEDKVFHELGNALLDVARELRESLLWLDRHAVHAAGPDTSRAVGVEGLHAGHLFKPAVAAELRKGVLPIDDPKALRMVWDPLGVQARNPQGASLEKSPVGAQAFLIFLQLFKDDSADDALVAQFSRAQAAESPVPKPVLAAHVLAIAAHRRVMGLRKGRSRSGARDDDQRSDDTSNDRSVSPMLSLRVMAERAGDVRLAGIDLDKELTGDDRPDDFDSHHPRSLRYLDPYTEFADRTDHEVDFREAGFPEHALRGVPHVAAPVLLQRWRLDLCLPVSDAEKNSPLRKADDKGVQRATKRGIHLHARRVNEAAFWLAASADARVDFVPDLLERADGTGTFAALVRQGLKSEGVEVLPALVFKRKLAEQHGRLPVLLWAGDTWVLAANRQARRFFARVVAELPSVRHRYLPSKPLVKAGTPQNDAVTSLDRFFAEELQRLLAQLETEAYRDRLKPLIAALQETVAELPRRREEDEAARELALADVMTLPLAVQDRGAQLQVHAPAVLGKLGDEYLLGSPAAPAVVVSPRLATSPAGQARLDAATGLLPLRAAIWPELEPDGHSMLINKTSPKTTGRPELARCKVPELQLQLRGLGLKTLAQPFGEEALPLVEREIDWAYSVWPGFEAPGWHYYIVSAICLGNQPVQDEPFAWTKPTSDVVFAIFGYPSLPGGKGLGALTQLAIVERGLPVRIAGVPVAVEVRAGGRVLGSQPVRLQKLPLKGLTANRIGVDFGTSNTCVAFQAAQGGDSKPQTHMVPLLPSSEDAIFFASSATDVSASRRSFLASTGNFFQARSALVDASDAATTIPSELLVSLHDTKNVADDQRTVLDRVYGRGRGASAYISMTNQGVADGLPLASPLFTPMPNRREGLGEPSELILWLANMVRTGENRIHGDLKWERPGDAGLEVSRQLRALFIEHVLVAALAQLRKMGYESFGKFVATQPEARTGVNDRFAGSFREDLEHLLARLGEVTGVAWVPQERDPEKVALVSETAAALLMYDLEDDRFPHSALTIDIGGGTTDVGVLLKAPDTIPQGDERDERRFTASARFAGNQLLRALVQLPELAKELDGVSGSGGMLSLDARAAMLKSQLRNSAPLVRSERVQAVTDMFFDAAFEYGLRVLMLFVQTRPGWQASFLANPGARMKVKLLGNGFKLFGKFRYASSADDTRALKSFLKDRLEVAVKAGMLSAELAARFDFEPEVNSKQELISKGAFNAVHTRADRFRPGATDVLVPGCLVTGPGTRHAEPRGTARRVNIESFGAEWLDRPPGQAPRQRLRLVLDDDTIQALFPLTLRHWADVGKAEDEVRSVFISEVALSEQYLDVGALYLTGMSGMHDVSSFSTLMERRVRLWSH